MNGRSKSISVSFARRTSTWTRLCGMVACARICISASTQLPSVWRRYGSVRGHPLLCTHFVDKFNERYRKNVKGISPAAHYLLIRNRWSGNARELENAIERAILAAKGNEVQPADLPEPIRDEASTNPEFSYCRTTRWRRSNEWRFCRRCSAPIGTQEAAHILGLYRPTRQQDAQAQHRGSGPCGARRA